MIGTGATGVQVIQEVAKTAGHLTVFQRSPNYCAPLLNRPIDAETQLEIKASYPEIFERCRESHGCFLHKTDLRKALEVTPEEREAFYEKLYGEPGFWHLDGELRDILTDPAANDHHQRVHPAQDSRTGQDAETAEKLIPRDHGFGTGASPWRPTITRLYNQPNVRLVDLRETPIERITLKGVKTSDAEYECDIIIYATGFDAITGVVRPHRHQRAGRACASRTNGPKVPGPTSDCRSRGSRIS